MTTPIPKSRESWVIHLASDRRQTYTKAMDSEHQAIQLLSELHLSSPGLLLEITKYDKRGKFESTIENTGPL